MAHTHKIKTDSTMKVPGIKKERGRKTRKWTVGKNIHLVPIRTKVFRDCLRLRYVKNRALIGWHSHFLRLEENAAARRQWWAGLPTRTAAPPSCTITSSLKRGITSSGILLELFFLTLSLCLCEDQQLFQKACLPQSSQVSFRLLFIYFCKLINIY